MKSKNIDLKYLKDKELLLSTFHQKQSRKGTKPKRNLKIFPGQQNETESDNNNCSQKKCKKQKKTKQSNQINQYIKKSQKMRCSITEQSNTQNNEEQKKQSKRKNIIISEKRNSQNFIGELNSYLHELKRSKLNLNQMGLYRNEINKSNTLPLQRPFKQINNIHRRQLQNQNTVTANTDRWQRKIKKEKAINVNLQKCIIEIQKVLWQRNDKLEALQIQLHRKSKKKQSFSRRINQFENNNFGKTLLMNRNLISKSQQIPKNKKSIILKEHNVEDRDTRDRDIELNEYSKISCRGQMYNDPCVEQIQNSSDDKIQRPIRFQEKKASSSIRFKEKSQQQDRYQEKQMQRRFFNDQIFSNTGVSKLKQFEKAKRQKSYNKLQKHLNM